MTSLTNEQNNTNPSDIKSLFTDFFKFLKRTKYFGIIFILISCLLSADAFDTYKEKNIEWYISAFGIVLMLLLNYILIFLLYFIYIRYKKKDERLNLLIEKIMPENSVLRNSIRRFSEIRKIDSGNWMLIFILLFSAGWFGTTIEEGIVGILAGIITLLVLRLILLLCYFFVKFTNTRFNIITIILIVITIYAAGNAL